MAKGMDAFSAAEHAKGVLEKAQALGGEHPVGDQAGHHDPALLANGLAQAGGHHRQIAGHQLHGGDLVSLQSSAGAIVEGRAGINALDPEPEAFGNGWIGQISNAAHLLDRHKLGHHQP